MVSDLPLDEDDIALLKSPYIGEIVEEIGFVREKRIAHCIVQCDDGGDEDVNSAPNIFTYDNVPLKKRHYLGTSDTFRSFEPLNEHACIVCDIADDGVVPCSRNECPLAVHRKCVELDCEDPATFYCPYCWFKEQATRSTALRTRGVAAAKTLVQYGCSELRSGDIVMTRENSQLENGSDNSLPMQLHENLHQLQELVKHLKARNSQLDESTDQFIDMEKSCGEAYAVVNDQPKRVLWTVNEEKMLREGVEKFSDTINKNMPWKKILEMGKGIFHTTRNSSDLKDKWRNMNYLDLVEVEIDIIIVVAEIGDQNGEGKKRRSDEEDESNRNHPKIRICGMVFVKPIT
ncbi:Myb-like domain [Arabidopsis suecica]|uniref:Myb-like domain n=1 Tax=Arabidopsis suecica TaxID=45249 RepID=A0A8T2GY35_ARASU|nr:Myb-like domain [Arabidopsis suecica]